MIDYLKLIGNTPLIEIEYKRFKLLLKLESFNPGGSIKDRIAYAMINDAEQKGIINKNTTIIEPTSGNTGIGLAMVCACKGYSLILTMPENMSLERKKILELYGAKLILTPAEKGMRGSVEKAEELALQIPGSYIPNQFKNKANPEIHYQTTGPEIWKQANENVDIFIGGVGSGGSISGVGKYLKEKNQNVHIVAVEPYNSPVLSGGTASQHDIQGIGAGFIPEILNKTIYNEIMTIKNEEAYCTAIELANMGLFCGVSSGAVVYAAYQVAQRLENKNKRIVIFIYDKGERYLNNFIEYSKIK